MNTRPEPRDGFSADIEAAYEGNILQEIADANAELQEIANEADYDENAFGRDGDYAGFVAFLDSLD